jgi:hypothetical protein
VAHRKSQHTALIEALPLGVPELAPGPSPFALGNLPTGPTRASRIQQVIVSSPAQGKPQLVGQAQPQPELAGEAAVKGMQHPPPPTGQQFDQQVALFVALGARFGTPRTPPAHRHQDWCALPWDSDSPTERLTIAYLGRRCAPRAHGSSLCAGVRGEPPCWRRQDSTPPRHDFHVFPSGFHPNPQWLGSLLVPKRPVGFLARCHRNHSMIQLPHLLE